MAGNLVPTTPVSVANYAVYYNGVQVASVVDVKLPEIDRGAVEAHPGGRVNPMTAPDGTEVYTDMEIEIVLGEPPFVEPLLAWWRSVVNAQTGIGLLAAAAKQLVQVVDLTNSAIPMKTHNIHCWPQKRVHNDRTGGKDQDPKKVRMTFKVQSYVEV